MKLIAFTGKKQTGKSTACTYLENAYNFTRHNFKDALVLELKQNFPDLLKEIGADYYSCSKEAVNKSDIDNLFQVKPPVIRTLMQNYGTNVRRVDEPNYWVNQWMKKSMEIYGPITVDDVRFKNEAWAIWSGGGIVIRLVRTDMAHTDTHSSETEMDEIVPAYTITCIGNDHEHLYKELDRIIS